MKKWVLLMVGVVNILLASETKDVTVQVISAVHEKSITDVFDAKLKKTGLEIHKNVEEGKFVVTLGEYKSTKQAQPALKKARTIVNQKAFVRPVHRSVDHQTVSSGDATVSQGSVTDHNSSSAEKPQVVVVTPVTIEKPIESIAVLTPSVNTEAFKRENYKNELSNAIDFYKTSPYHRFEPVALRQ